MPTLVDVVGAAVVFTLNESHSRPVGKFNQPLVRRRMDAQKLTDIVNQSGFPLQMRMVALVEKTRSKHGWNVRGIEHSWKNQFDDDSGFVDLVLVDHYGTSIMLVECKRVLDSSWIFLKQKADGAERWHAKAWVTRYAGESLKHAGWVDLTLDPPTPECEFCVVPGQDPKSKPMLERVAGELVSATEAYALEEQVHQVIRSDSFKMYFSVIVTTATLQVCTIDPEEVSLHDGKVAAAEFAEVPFVRFRKQLSTRPVPARANANDSFYDFARAKEHTVFVVNAASLPQFLSEFELGRDSVSRFE